MAAPRVLISNATRLHAHHHAYALQQAGMLKRFITSIWHKPDEPVYRWATRLPGRLGRATRSFLAKRYHPGLRAELVEQRWGLELVRIAVETATRGRFTDRLLFLHKGAHDRAVARRVAALKPDVVVGYEISCPRTFESARRVGAVTVLDLAGLHHDFTAGIARQHGLRLANRRLEHNLRARKLRELELADHVLTISDLARQTLIEAGVAPGRISVVRLGVSLQTFRPKETYRQDGPFRILYVGNVSRAKGVDVLLEAFASLELPSAELVLVGSQADRTFLDRFAGRYTHIPYLDHGRLAEEYRKADVFVLPTLYDSWGLVVAEAMASGTPVIVTTNCGAKELVDPDCGWIVAPADPAALAAAIKSAYDGRRDLEAMGRHARAVVQGYDWEAYHLAVTRCIATVWARSKLRNASACCDARSDAATS